MISRLAAAGGTASRTLSICLAAALLLGACGRSVVRITPPYAGKIRPGDGARILMLDGTIMSGRVTYVDASVVVIRTPKQVLKKNPVVTTQFGTTINWADIHSVMIAGTLDSQNKLVSNEEIRVNQRTNHRRNLGINVGLLGAAASFLLATHLQDRVSDPFDPSDTRHTRGRITFWTTLILGSAGSAAAGYYSGGWLDRKISIARIERQRSLARAKADTVSTSNPERDRQPTAP